MPYKDKQYGLAHKRVYNKTLNGRYRTYKQDAKRRNIEFLISKEEFKQFWNMPCYYCGGYSRNNRFR